MNLLLPPPDIQLESLRHLQRVPLTLRAELDRRLISVRDLLELRVDSILELERPAGENISLFAEDVLLGSGEVLVVDSSLAVRVAELRDKPPDPISEQPANAETDSRFLS